MSARHGLVIGKFYPPHRGHQLLVDSAARCCERVTVVAMAASHESIPLQRRLEWLRAIHAGQPNVVVTGIVDDVPVDYHDAAIWDAHVALMREALAQVQAPPVDAVFTSEPYGDELARRFGARAVAVDTARRLVPVSASKIRAGVPASWDFLPPPVRAGLALKLVVVGAESTGTTTLSLALAQALRERGGAHGLTRWVPEYGREYSVQKIAAARAAAQLAGRPKPRFDALVWRSDEFVHIAQTQIALQQAEAALGGPVLVCDTDAFATGIWHERYCGTRHAPVDALAETCRGDLYLLTDHAGVPFEQDGLRDGELIRAWMTGRFEERLQDSGRTWRKLTGPHEWRLAQALQTLDEFSDGFWRFEAPFG